MKQTKGFKRTVSLVFVLCLVLSFFGSRIFATGDDFESKNSNTTQTNIISTVNRAPNSSTLRAEHSDVITKIEAQTYNGSGPQGDTGQWDVFRLYAEFALTNNQFYAGDTTVITLPDEIKFNQTSSFEIKDGAGNLIANAVFNGNKKTLTLTYTDFVENNSDISGSFYFYVQIDRNNVDEAEDIEIRVDVSGTTVIGNTIHFLGIPEPTPHYLIKSGWQATSLGNRALRYQLLVNTKGEAVQNVVVTDKIASPGFTILTDSFVILKGTWAAVHGEWQLQNETDVTANYDIIWNDVDSFTVNLGNITGTEGFVIRYTAEASYDLVDGEVIKNNATIRGTNIGSHYANANTYYYVAGGSGEGYVYTIHIVKEDTDGNSLSGAVFNVIRNATNQVVGTVTTDPTGEALVSGLLKDSYYIQEVSPPDGYILLNEQVFVDMSDFNSDKIATKTIINEVEKTSVEGFKTWDDNDDQDGARPESITIRLLADGTQVDSKTVTEVDNWSWSFTNLPKFENGVEINYSITEDAVSDYTTEYNGYNVTNAHTPGKTSLTVSKAWDDADNQDGIRPESVTVKLLADGQDTGKTVELNTDNNWTGSFIELDEYRSGQKIVYTVEEAETAGYTAVITGDAEIGYTITNTHDPEKTDITVTKVWDDEDNKNGNRPQSVTIRLLADGNDTGKTLVLSADNKWESSFENLELYKGGNKIEYTIVEADVSGYTSAIEGDYEKGFTVTNTDTTTTTTTNADVSDPQAHTNSPKTDDTGNVFFYLCILSAFGCVTVLLMLKLRKKGKHSA